MAQALPLSGIRVLELAEGWAGPMTAMWLGDLGAEVIKVEAIQRYDHARGQVNESRALASYPNKSPGPRPYDVAGAYIQANRNKLDATIDLSRAKGVGLFKELIAISDVVVTNMVTGVPEKMGIGYHDLVKVRPDLIMLISSGYGASGPYARRVTMGGAMDGIAGYTWLRHYPDQTPDTASFSIHTDVVTGMNNSMAVQMAVYHRNKTGKGQMIETSGVEASLHQTHVSLMDYALNGRVRTAHGNSHEAMSPHGCYPCAGDDRWINITVCNEGQWNRLCEVMGKPSWASEPQFATHGGRVEHREALNERITEWTRTQEQMELMHRLQKAGVPAGAVYDQSQVAQDPHYAARGCFQRVTLSGYGDYPIPTSPWTMDGRHVGARMPPPRLAEHNDYVFRELLHLPSAVIEELQREEFIGERPVQKAI